MPPPNTLTVQMSTVTPLFLGGAEPNERAELRPASIKGLLRYWYRALDANYRANEPRLFGSHDGAIGQSPCLLRVSEWREGTQPWDDLRYRRKTNEGGFTRPQQKNGIVYLGYTLTLGDNRRKAIPADTRFTLEIIPRPGHNQQAVRRAWIGALWALVHIGGAGSRSRRGLGSLRIDRWSGWPECAQLPLACAAESTSDWHAQLASGLGRLTKSWFIDPYQASGNPTHTSGGSLFVLPRRSYRSWETALDSAGLAMQTFRQHREPDNKDVLAFLQRQPLKAAPQRAAFGLPITYRFQQLGGEEVLFQPANYDRMASPLFFRIIKLGSAYYTAFAHLNGSGLPAGEQLTAERTGWQQGGQSVFPQHPVGSRIVRDFVMEQYRVMRDGKPVIVAEAVQVS